jgi:hypothetical protein
VTTFMGCTTTNTSISSEDLRLMKEQSGYLLTIVDSSRCTPDLFRYRSTEKCYRMLRLNRKFRNYKIVFDTVRTDSYLSYRVPDESKSNSQEVRVRTYVIQYRIYDKEQLIETRLLFTFRRDRTTQRLYCDDVREDYGLRHRTEPIDDDIPYLYD